MGGSHENCIFFDSRVKKEAHLGACFRPRKKTESIEKNPCAETFQNYPNFQKNYLLSKNFFVVLVLSLTGNDGEHF